MRISKSPKKVKVYGHRDSKVSEAALRNLGDSNMDRQNENESIQELRNRLKEKDEDYASLDLYAKQIRKERDTFKKRVDNFEQHRKPQTENKKVRSFIGFYLNLICINH